MHLASGLAGDALPWDWSVLDGSRESIPIGCRWSPRVNLAGPSHVSDLRLFLIYLPSTHGLLDHPALERDHGAMHPMMEIL